MASFFEGIPTELPEELFATICSYGSVKIERIVSRGHSSPEGFWYDQEQREFVIILRGSAELRVEGQEGTVVLEQGDYLVIDAHVRHRVEWTDQARDTVWLAVHY